MHAYNHTCNNPPYAYQRPEAAQVGPSSGFSRIMHRLVSRDTRTVASKGICTHRWAAHQRKLAPTRCCRYTEFDTHAAGRTASRALMLPGASSPIPPGSAADEGPDIAQPTTSSAKLKSEPTQLSLQSGLLIGVARARSAYTRLLTHNAARMLTCHMHRGGRARTHARTHDEDSTA